MMSDTHLIHQDDICECGATLDCWQGDFPQEGYRYTKWVCQDSEMVVSDSHEPIPNHPEEKK